MKNIADLFTKIRKKDFIITGNPETLFTPDFSLLKDKRCPKCSLKLYQTYNKKMWVCKGKKHKKQFVVTDKKIRTYTQG